MALDEHIRQLLKELGDAINDSISESEHVNERIQRIREEGYNLYVVLDATIGLNRDDGSEAAADPDGEREMPTTSAAGIQFRINVNDLAFLRSLGIDPTRKVRTTRKIEGRNTTPESDGRDES